MSSLAAIRIQKEGPVYPHRLVRDFRTSLEKSRPISRQSGRPSFWPLIADKDAATSANFSRSDIGLDMGPKVGLPQPRLGPEGASPGLVAGCRNSPNSHPEIDCQSVAIGGVFLAAPYLRMRMPPSRLQSPVRPILLPPIVFFFLYSSPLHPPNVLFLCFSLYVFLRPRRRKGMEEMKTGRKK